MNINVGLAVHHGFDQGLYGTATGIIDDAGIAQCAFDDIYWAYSQSIVSKILLEVY